MRNFAHSSSVVLRTRGEVRQYSIGSGVQRPAVILSMAELRHKSSRDCATNAASNSTESKVASDQTNHSASAKSCFTKERRYRIDEGAKNVDIGQLELSSHYVGVPEGDRICNRRSSRLNLNNVASGLRNTRLLDMPHRHS